MINLKKQSGFTLVEIAIVLVIIGLLLGGILKGQELITSARVRNLADQNSGIQAAYYGFIDRYRAIPGDMPANNAINAIGVAGLLGGNGNGQLDQGSLDEALDVWHHLSNAGFITGLYAGIDASGNPAGSAIAVGGYQTAGATPVNAFQGSILLGTSNEYQIPAGAPAAAARLLFSFGTQIPVNVLRELDVKIDDSAPLTGIMRGTAAGVGNSFGVVVDVNTGAAPACTIAGAGAGAPTIWNIAGAQQNCNAVYIY